LEPVGAAALSIIWTREAIADWLYLVIFASLIGYSIYMQLLRDIGPARAGGFAFVSPAIAVGVGGVLVGEVITLQSVAGMTTMMLAAIVVCWQIGLAPSFWR